MPLKRLIFNCCLLIAATCITAFGQSATATLSGTVTDQNGAVVPGVAISVINPATSLERTATTNDSGYFSIPLLPPGTYTVTAKRDGFAPLRAENVVLNVGDQKSLQIQLKAGDINATVQVINDADLIRTDAAVGTVVDRQFVANIPLNGRSFQSLITLTPGVVVVPSGTNTTGQFSVNGQRAGANAFTVDGVGANFVVYPAGVGATPTGNLPSLTAFGTTQSLVSVDALQEFKVQTSTYAAEYGRQPGGQVSIVTRSGTNQFHGSLFDYVRNDVFDANDWFANANRQPKPPERQNDFGGTFSGPVLLPRFGESGRQPGYNGRNRTFFFFSYEGLRLRLPQFSLTNVPTLALRQQAPAGMQPILNAFPLPNGKDLGNGLAELSAGYSNAASLNATSLRIDHTTKSKLTLFARYNKVPSETISRDLGTGSLTNVFFGHVNIQTVTGGVTASFTPRAINDLRVNYSSADGPQKITQDNFAGAIPPPRSALIPSQYDSSSAFGLVLLLFSGITSTSFPAVDLSDGISNRHQLNIVDSFSYGTGSHQFKFGFDYRRLTSYISLNTYVSAGLFFSSQQVLTATAPLVIINAALPRKPVITNLSAYGQDTWKVARRLTIDLGLRWDVNPAPTEANGNDQPAVTGIGNLATMQLAPLGTKPWKTTYNNFAPRFGIAYLLRHKPGRETVVRGGFGVFYDTGNDNGAQNFNQGFPYVSSRVLFNLSYPLSPPQVAPATVPVPLTPPFPSFYAFDPALRLPYTLQWNFAVQQSIGKSQAVTVSYVGAAGRRLLQATQLDLSKINPSFTTVFLTRNRATSDYDALQAQFQRRLSRGWQALVSYTWSHALDDDSDGNTLRVAQRGNAAFDIRHVFAAAATYDIPAPRNIPLVRTILGRWSIDTSVVVRSGLPVDLVATTLTNPADGSLVNVRPNVNVGVPFYISDPTVPGGRKINAAAFSIPAVGQSGNFGRNQLRGLGAWQVDSALRRQFKVTEKVSLQFRAEAFNLFNHPNFGAIQTSLTAANFGQETNMLNRQLGGLSQLYQIGGPRSLQFAVKIMF